MSIILTGSTADNDKYIAKTIISDTDLADVLETYATVANLSGEVSTRTSADTTLSNSISTLNTNLTAETSARQSADTALSSSISTLSTSVTSNTSTLNTLNTTAIKSTNLCTTAATTTTSASSTSPAVIVENYVNETFWYRVWSDGWIEQGGYLAASSTDYITVTITLLKSYSNTNYTVSKNIYGGVGGATVYYNEVASSLSKSTSSFTTYNRSTSGWVGFNWYACGY